MGSVTLLSAGQVSAQPRETRSSSTTVSNAGSTASSAPSRSEATRLAEAARGAAELAMPCTSASVGCYRETDGTWRNADRAYHLRLGAPSPHYGRTVAELAAGLAGGTIWYVIDPGHDVANWDAASWRQRFHKSAYRYDTNVFRINFVGHALSGTAYYASSRTNELGVPGAAMAAFSASWVWEFFLEFRDRVSLNDALLTPVAGIAIGEFVHKLGAYFSSAPGGGDRKHRALRWMLGAPAALHDELDGERPPPSHLPTDERGFGTDIAARFEIAHDVALARPREGSDFVVHGVRLGGRLVAIPGYLQAGTFRRSFADGDVTAMRLQIDGGVAGTGVELRADTMLLGLHDQSIVASEDGLRGSALTVGSNVAYEYHRRAYDEFEDRLGAVGLPGLAFDGHVFAGPVSVHASARLQGEFAGVHSGSFASWKRAHPDEQAKSALRKHGYYYGWGGSARASAELRVPRLRLGGSLRYGGWNSHEGLDRNQEAVTADVHAADRLLDYGAWARLVPFDFGLFVETSYRRIARRSRVEGHTRQRALQRYRLSVGVQR